MWSVQVWRAVGAEPPRASGTQLICSDYMWQVNVGQRPKTDWGDGQREWAECLESNTQAECRRRLNR